MVCMYGWRGKYHSPGRGSEEGGMQLSSTYNYITSIPTDRGALRPRGPDCNLQVELGVGLEVGDSKSEARL